MGRFLVTACAAAVVLAGDAGAAHPTALVLSQRGVDGLTLGRTLAAVRGAHLVAALTPGCELTSPLPYAGTITRSALKGSVTFDGRSAGSRITGMEITAGAVTARGIGIGSTANAVRHAYRGAHAVDSTTPLSFHALVLRSSDQDRIWFMLDRHGGRVTSFALPALQACE